MPTPYDDDDADDPLHPEGVDALWGRFAMWRAARRDAQRSLNLLLRRHGDDALPALMDVIAETVGARFEVVLTHGALDDDALYRCGLYLDELWSDAHDTEAYHEMLRIMARLREASITQIVDEVIRLRDESRRT